jgi:hypothetical protein
MFDFIGFSSTLQAKRSLTEACAKETGYTEIDSATAWPKPLMHEPFRSMNMTTGRGYGSLVAQPASQLGAEFSSVQGRDRQRRSAQFPANKLSENLTLTHHHAWRWCNAFGNNEGISITYVATA